MSEIVERVKEYIDKKGISISAFERSVGMSNASFSKSLKGGGAIGTDKLENILRVYKDLSPTWLMTGEGEMLNPSHDATASHTFSTKADRNVATQDVPLYDFGASAGLVEIFNNASVLPIDTLRIPHLPPVDGAVFVRGDSMSPLLKSGDIVLYKKKDLSISSIIWGEIYILSFLLDNDSYTAVKYIRKSAAQGMVTLASFNPDFAPMDIPMSSITALALVKASISFHTME